MRQEQQKRELVLVELGGLSQVSERRRLIGGTRLSSLHEVAARAPAFRNLLAVVSIRRSGWIYDRDHATSSEQQAGYF
jgi:hypothetical protein